MKFFGNFLKNWNGMNFEEELKKNSNSKICLQFLLDILSGQNFWDTISKYIDPIGREIILSKNFFCLNLLGEYILFKEEMKQKLFNSFIYPSILIFISIIICFLYKTMLDSINISIKYSYIFVFIVITIFLVIILIYYLVKLTKQIFILWIFKLFIANNINYEIFLNIISGLDKNLFNKIKISTSTDCITKIFLNNKYTDKENTDRYILQKINNLTLLRNNIQKYFSYLLVANTGIFICLLFTSTIQSVYEATLCITESL